VAAAAVHFLTPFLLLVTHGIICKSAFGPVRLYALLRAHPVAIPTLALQCPQPMNSTDWLRILDIWTHYVCTHSLALLLSHSLTLLLRCISHSLASTTPLLFPPNQQRWL
jgi:hypothetical protein